MPLSISNKHLRIILWCLHLSILFSAVYFYPVSWDEGWTFCSARHLLEDHHFGCKYNGNFTTTRLITSLSTVLMAYVGFVLFGVSYISGRLIFATQAILLVLVLSRLARRFWGEQVELIVLAYLLFISSDPRVHPMVLGAQAWGEVPALLYFILGTLLIPAGFSGKMVGTIFQFGTSISLLILSACTKVQFRPFIAAALLSSSLILVFNRGTRPKARIFSALGLITWIVPTRLPHLPIPESQSIDLTGVVDMGMEVVRRLAIVTDLEIRFVVFSWLITTQEIILPLAIISLFIKSPDGKSPWRLEYHRILPLLTFSVVTLGWFLTLSINFPRYAAPGLICAAIPAALAAFIFFSAPSSNTSLSYTLPVQTTKKLRSYALWVCIFVALCNLAGLIKSIFWNSSYNHDLYKTAAFVNLHYQKGDVIETYDSNLYHLLNVPYVYPADNYHLLSKSERATERERWGQHSARYIILGDWSRHFEIANNLADEYSERIRYGEFVIFEKAGSRSD